jgi:hypothetical protein
LVTSSEVPMSRPSSWPVTRLGWHSVQCFTIFSTARPSSCTLRSGSSALGPLAAAAQLLFNASAMAADRAGE